MSGVKFWKGVGADFMTLQKDPNILYFVLDECKIFLGAAEITNNNTSVINGFEEDITNSEISASWGSVAIK